MAGNFTRGTGALVLGKIRRTAGMILRESLCYGQQQSSGVQTKGSG